jgi:hypothetical protein
VENDRKEIVMETPIDPSGSGASKLSRPGAVARLRTRLQELSGEEKCVCRTVGKLHVFCGGFDALSDAELRQGFDWIARGHPDASRAELEDLAALYYEVRRTLTGAEICCDVETRERMGCTGWNQFDNQELEKFHRALIGTAIEIG